MPRLSPLFAALIAVTGGVFVATTQSAHAQTAKPDSAAALTIGSTAPKLPVGAWVKGKPVSLTDGKVHVVEFWATWCGPCKTTIPHLTEIAKKYAGKADVTGVSVWERGADVPAKVKAFVKEMGATMDYHVARDDAKGTIAASWMEAAGQGGIPTAFIVDQKGKVVWIGHPMDGLDETLGKVIAGKYDVAAAKKAFQEKKDAEAKEEAKSAKMQELFGPAVELAQKSKFAEAVAAIDKALETSPEYAGDVAFLKFRLLMSHDEAAAQTYAAKAASAELKNNAETLNELAWGIVAPDSKVKKPDYTAAVTIAEAAVAASQEKIPAILDTLSYAYEKAGDLDKAIAAEEKAVALFPADAKSEEMANFMVRVAELKKLKAATGK